MTDPTPGDWRPCPPGEVTRLSAWLKLRRKLWTAATVGGIVLATAVGTTGAVWAVRAAVDAYWTKPGKKPQKIKTKPGTMTDIGVEDPKPLRLGSGTKQ